MKKLALAVAATMFATACQETSGPAPASPAVQPSFSSSGAGEAIPGQYIVVLRESVEDVPGVAREIAARHGGTLRFTYTHALKGFALNISAEAAALIASDPRVAYVEQDKVVRAITDQANPTWGIDRIDERDLPLDNNYHYEATGAGVTVYIIDTGIRFTHTEFGGRAVSGTDKIDNDDDATDCHGHGTHVAGTVGGTTYGVAKNVRLVGVRVLDCSGSGTDAGVIAGIDWVTADHQAGQPAAANMSLGGGFSQALNDAVRNSVNDGVVHAVAAGNEYGDPCIGSTTFPGTGSPASEPSAITVGATNSSDVEASFSNNGPCLDIWAPGVDITSAWIGSDNATETISGTSMATPHVAGAAALYLEGHPNATADDVDKALSDNATMGKITWNNPFGQKKPAPANLLLYSGFITGAPPTPPAAPSNLTATAASHSQINLAWSDNSDNESSFKIERCQGTGCTSFAQIATAGPGATSYQDTGLSGSTTYLYRVRASNAGGNSDYSNVADATTPAPPSPPAAPSNLTATAVSNSQIDLAWSDNSGNESGFKIERCTGASCTNFAQIATVSANVTTYQNTGLAVGTTYSYRVRATNDGGDSGYSNTATATTFDNPPVAKFTWTCGAKGGRVCNFNGTSSTDDKGITSYSWDFGDGTTGTGATVTKTYDSRGTYTVVLTVSDGVNPGQSCAKSVSTGTSGACP